MMLNRNKRGMAVNLKTPGGVEVVKKLLSTADVVTENYRKGTLEKLGLGYDVLEKLNPRLVYCAISGFGQTGPDAQKPAYDQIIQGLSGMMSVTGTPESAPLRSGYPVADTLAGMTAAFAISSALVRRNASGEGAFIDVSMLDSALTAMGWAVSNYLIAGVEPRPHGNDNFTAAPSGAFRAKDGLINIAANKQEQFEALVAAVGRPELATDPRFAERESRKHHRGALTLELEAALKNRACADWQSVFNKIGVPAGCVLTVPQALALAQVEQRELLKTFDEVPGLDRAITVARSGFTLSGGDPDVADPPPELGSHTDEVLAEAGYSAGEIAALREAGIV
jgi:crotonobetainyl-CoA:carnitine CoA-transferase CaiB-like acyl-CoA transferase